MNILLTAGGEEAAGIGMMGMLAWLVIMFGFLYFFMMRPQKKERKKHQEMISQVAIGDSVLTNSGFYGTIIDISDDTVIVEFGNNKNCRIPMQKGSISQIEKPEAS
jgi:preprotein translocase subunit YajC